MAHGVPTRRLLALLYLAAVIILADQITDVAATVLLQPVATGTANWRVAVFGMGVSRASVLLIADTLLFIAAIGLEHRLVLRTLSVAHGLLALIGLAALAMFALDAVEVQRMVRPDGRNAFFAATGRAGVVAVLGIGLLGWAALAGWKMSRASGKPGRSDRASMLMPTARDSREGK
jgi:hypothetical protein